MCVISNDDHKEFHYTETLLLAIQRFLYCEFTPLPLPALCTVAMRLFDEPLVNESTPSILNTEEHQHLAYTAALQGITVAKRPTGKWPPISATTAGVKIAVIGPNGGCKVQSETAFKDPVDGMAGSHQGSSPISSPNRLSKPDLCDAQTNMIGPYVQYGTGVEIETVYEYLAKESGSATINFARGCEIDNYDMSELPGALKIAAEADFIVLVRRTVVYVTGMLFQYAY